MNKLFEVLSHCPLFAGIDKIELENILSQIEYKTKCFKKGEFIYRIGQPSLYLGIIINGSIEAQKNYASGKILSMLYRNKGDIFGGTAVFSNNTAHLCDIIAKETSEVLLLKKQTFFKIFCINNKVAANVLDMCANTVSSLNTKIEMLSYSSINKKIAFSLLYELNPNNSDIIHLPYSKKSWAEFLNVSRTSLCRELKILCDNKLIEINNKDVKIVQKKRLQALITDSV